jgi:hypothetical protein
MTNREPASDTRTSGRSIVGGVLSQSVNGWLEHRLPEWPKVWAACTRRTHSWPAPPRWSLSDWWEELDTEGIASACRAIRMFDPGRAPSLGGFVCDQILASALSRYRQEWKYALRYVLSAREDAGISAPEDPFAFEHDEEQLKRKLTEIPDADCRLIE